MSDKTEAEILGKVFKILGETINRDRRGLADEIWELVLQYEADPKSLKCDQTLEDFELSEKCENCGGHIYQDIEHTPEECDG